MPGIIIPPLPGPEPPQRRWALPWRLPRRWGLLLLLAPMLAPSPLAAQDFSSGFAAVVERVWPAVVNVSVTALNNEPLTEAESLAPALPPPAPPSQNAASDAKAADQKTAHATGKDGTENGTAENGATGSAPGAGGMANAMTGTPMARMLRERMRARHVKLVGSGFIIDKAGLIVTNYHVIAKAAALDVTLADGTILPARVVGADDFSDIAILRVDPPHPLPVVTWGDSSKLRAGEWVIAIGNPFGLGTSISVGTFSARGRDIGADPYDDFLQIDAAINPGNSGGPLFDIHGQVVGINTATEAPAGGSVGIGFAIPSEFALSVIDVLRSQHHIERGWLGARFTGNALAPQDDGVEIDRLQPGGPGAASGLRVADRLLAVNGDPVETPRDVVRDVAALAPGTTAEITLRRHGHDLQIPVVIGRRPSLGGE
uniref:Probable periplasmic serine endoprotease DegP-like n=1 Tax=Acidicaldus sp. TaxID=1872105 RepID=A0A8J4H9K0_9PROT